MKKSDFNYHLPKHLIAQKPLDQRIDSRLLSLNKSNGILKDQHFVDFIDLVNKNDLLILNDTKVIPARLFGNKLSGGKVELLIERILDDCHAMAHIHANKTPKIGSIIELSQGFKCIVISRYDDLFKLEFIINSTLLELLYKIGHIALPPYINRADNTEDLSRYQTIFAKHLGAIAAPTAGLHFDENTINKLSQKGVAKAFVTLHVGSGTFQPLRYDDLSKHKMHKEYFSVSQATVDAIQLAKARGGRIVAVGTTTVRALESATKSGRLQVQFGDTDLFITPNYSFQTVDAIFTNFHLPESTLLMLISAFAGYENVRNAYQHAIKQSYRFFSYGDAMFLF